MTYLLPDEVQGSANNIRVIFDGGAESYSVAIVNWKGKDNYAVRWNGKENKPLGFPVFGKNALWFILPKEIALDGIQGIIGEIYK